MYEYDDYDVAEGAWITNVYLCPENHETLVDFSADAEVPKTWTCADCGEEAKLRGTEDITEFQQTKKDPMIDIYKKLFERHSQKDLDEMMRKQLKTLKKNRIVEFNITDY